MGNDFQRKLKINLLFFESQVKVETEKKGKKVPRFDAMIAAVAINRGFKLFTFNRKHFEAFGDLTLV